MSSAKIEEVFVVGVTLKHIEQSHMDMLNGRVRLVQKRVSMMLTLTQILML